MIRCMGGWLRGGFLPCANKYIAKLTFTTIGLIWRSRGLRKSMSVAIRLFSHSFTNICEQSKPHITLSKNALFIPLFCNGIETFLFLLNKYIDREVADSFLV